jgi:excisionase family DNA binding protein
VEKFKKQMGASENGSGASVGLSRRSPGGASVEDLVQSVQAALLRVEALPRLTVMQIRTTEKLTLTLAEAAELSGLSRGFLREAIAKKKLKGIRGAGRGFRIKRSDLETFVRGLS